MISIPYGVSHFPSIRRRGQVFIDRTGYIRALEAAADHVLFLRPRRFGKSLWISILEHYYGLRFADDFEELFGGLDIGEQPTELHGRFLVLVLDFSAVDTQGDDVQLRRSFTHTVKSRLSVFLRGHRKLLASPDETLVHLRELDDPVSALQVTLEAVEESGRPLYLLVDEYDNFTNELIATRQEGRYQHLVHGTGMLKTFFKAIKEWTRSGVVARTFITGVNPLLLDDLTSGFNIAANLSIEREFARMLGFDAKDVRGLVDAAVEGCDSSAGVVASLPSPAEVYELMVAWYDGYRFHHDTKPLFNPDMVLYAMRSIVRGRLPEELLDTNLRTDLGKLNLVLRKSGDFGRLWRLMEAEGTIAVKPNASFGLERLAEPANFHSLLYYLGMLGYDEGPEPRLRIPNYAVRTLYWSEVQRIMDRELALDGVKRLREALRQLMRSAEGEPFFRLLLEQVIAVASNRDLIHFNEAGVKAAALAFLSLSDEISVFSEWETARGYADLVIVPAPGASWLSRAWMIELKYVKKKQDTPAKRKRLLAEGQGELRRYLANEQRMRYLSRFELHSAVALFVDAQELVWEDGPVVGTKGEEA